MKWKIFLAFLLIWVIFKFCECYDWNPEIKEKVKALGVPQAIPNVLKRFYAKWSQKDSCLPEVLKSFEIQVKKSRHPRYDFRIQTILNSAFIKAELWIEFYGLNYRISRENMMKRKYVIDIKHRDSQLKVASLECSTVVINGNLAELSCDMTAFYSSLRRLDKKFTKVSIYLYRRRARRITREFQGTSVKAFVVLYEKNEVCTKFPIGHTLDAEESYFHPQKSREFLKSNEETDSRRGISWRVKRAVKSKFVQDVCSLKDWQVSFEKIGFERVIAPSRAAIYKCTGECIYWKDHATNYSMFRRFLTLIGVGTKTCCVPVEYGSMTLIQYDADEEMIVVTQYPDMVAKKCGCS